MRKLPKYGFRTIPGRYCYCSHLSREWKCSKKGNEYLKIDGHIVALYHDTKGKDIWKYSIDNEFYKGIYPTSVLSH